MSTTIEHTIAQHLAELGPALLPQVAEQLAARLPMIGVDPALEGRHVVHYRNMLSTAERFHNMAQIGADIDWGPVSFEFAWAARVLLPLGATAEHQLTMVDVYFATARGLASWSDEELAALDELEAHMRAEVAQTYHT